MTTAIDLIEQGSSGLHPSDDLDAARAAALEHGWHVIELDTSGVTDKLAFMAVCREAFHFPDWFGANWDALADSLTDVDDSPGALVLWRGAGHLDAVVRETAADVFTGRVGLTDRGFAPFLVLVGSQ